MTKELYLELVRKLDVLINDEILEREKIFTLSTKTTQELSDMPHAPGVSDKVGNLAVKLAMKQQDINHCIDVYVDLKDEIRQVVAGLAKKYDPEELVDRKVIVVANLQPAKLFGVESNGMLLATDSMELLTTEGNVGEHIK